MWNWQHEHWPKFEWDVENDDILWQKFTNKFNVFIGASFHCTQDEKKNIYIDILSTEALETSKIEGEFFSLESLQSSLLKNFGLETVTAKSSSKEEGIAKAFKENYQYFGTPLSHEILFQWNSLLRYGNPHNITSYRNEPVYVVSYGGLKPKIHFEGVESPGLIKEMTQFLEWFKSSKNIISPLVRASIAHLYFASIHPFGDGNGRISRMLSERCISESIGQPALLSLSLAIQKKKSEYYKQLQYTNRTLEISSWIRYFSQIILEAQEISLEKFQFIIKKNKFFQQYADQINPRQTKAINRIFQEGVDGFLGGMSSENYIKITKTSRATATRDLSDLVQKGLFSKTGKLKSTRYFLSSSFKTLSKV